jgi:GNAT superfamily N-acetyltransferase
MQSPDGFQLAEAAPEHGPLLASLFERESCACHCRYWHFTGDKNAWLDRTANDPAKSRDEMLAALAAQSDEMRGVVALSNASRAAGWMKLAPAETLTKLYAQRLYRGLPCFAGDRTRIYAVGCFLIEGEARRRGLARSMLRFGVEAARRWGARAIEAFPRRAELARDYELWTGPDSIFTELGFQEVHDFVPYPVLRLVL